MEIVKFLSSYSPIAKAAMILALVVLIGVAVFARRTSEEDPAPEAQTPMSALNQPHQPNPVSIGAVHGNVVVSNNQQGGITAGVVNLHGKKQRRMNDPSLKTELTKAIVNNPGKTFEIIAPFGDEEAFAFAREVKAHMDANGAKTEGVTRAVMNEVHNLDVLFDFRGGLFRIVIGPAQ